jgi:tetratricopeptide (TPR) repeat protein
LAITVHNALIKLYSILIIFLLVFTSGCKTVSEGKSSGSSNDYKKRKAFEAAFYEANKQKILNNKEKALQFYKDALAINPNSHETMYQISKLFYQDNKFSEALYWAEKSVQTNSQFNHWYSGQLAQYYSKFGKYEKSAEVFATMIKNEPEVKENYKEAASQFYNAEKIDKSIEMLKAMQNQFGVEQESSTRLGYVYSSNGKKDLAVLEMEKLAEHHPDNIQYKGYLAEAYLDANQQDKAIAIFNEVVSINSKNGKAHFGLYTIYQKQFKFDLAYPHLREAFRYDDLTLIQKLQAISTYFLVLSRDPIKQKEAEELSDILLQVYPSSSEPYLLKSDIYGTLGDFSKAREYNLKAITLEPSNFKLWTKLLSIDERLMDNALQLEDAEKALALFPNMTVLYAQMGYAYVNLEKYDEAIGITDQGLDIAIDKNDKIDLLLCQSAAYNKMNKYAKADKIFESILAISPYNSAVLNNFAFSLANRKENLSKADSLIDVALKMEPTNPFFLDTKAWVLYGKKDYTQALKLLDKCMEINPKNPEYYIHAKEIFETMGNKTMANQMQDKINKLNAK